MNEKVVLIGAGSAMFTRGLVADLIRRNEPCSLGLVDIDPQALAVAEGLTGKMIAAKQAPIQLCASTDRREVLRGATVVICTVGVGGRRAWEQDVFIPRKYGIYQPVGDTVMPGGTSRALRMIPAMVEIAKDVLDLCPDALFFNYGNPMSPVCRGIRKATGANVTGLCHGVFHVGKWLAEQLGAGPERMQYTAVGINHLTWFTEIRVDGQDAIPRLQAIARQKLGQAQSLGDVTDAFSWQLTELFGAFPAVLDRHVTEFFPHLFSKKNSYYGKTLGLSAAGQEGVNDAYSFEGTIAHGDRIFAEMREQVLSPDPLPPDYFERISGEHEQVLDIVASIRRDSGDIYSANLPNQGQVPNLPADAVIECPAVATASGMKAIAQRPLSPGLAGTLATRFQWVETVVDAAISGDRKQFVQALLIDGAVDSVETANRLAGELLAAHAAYLPQFKQN
ncbi:MAG: hypothetical protein M1546_01505 [Chloroflexi bacterium]|nr:hypothetical protein [Chloroflexota bacterium]